MPIKPKSQYRGDISDIYWFLIFIISVMYFPDSFGSKKKKILESWIKTGKNMKNKENMERRLPNEPRTKYKAKNKEEDQKEWWWKALKEQYWLIIEG